MVPPTQKKYKKKKHRVQKILTSSPASSLKNYSTHLNITSTIFSNLTEKGSRLALRSTDNHESYTYTELKEIVTKVAGILVQQGIKKGDHCGLISYNCPKWVITDLAIQRIGAVCVPIYWRSSPEHVEYVLRQVNPKIIFVGDHHLAKLAKNCLQQQGNKSVSKNKNPLFVSFTSPNDFKNDSKTSHSKVLSWKKFTQVSPQKIQRSTSPQDLARIVYTSGSTGQPKGVMLTHENLAYEVYNLQKRLNITEKDRFVSYLPLNHMFGLIGEIYVPLFGGSEVYVTSDPHKAMSLLPKVQPTLFLTVPFILEKIYQQVLEKTSKLRLDHFFTNLTERQPSFLQRLFLKMIGGKIKKKLGGKIRSIVSGGAHLSRDVELFFYHTKIPLHQGYGMTEAAPVISLNTPTQHKLYSVGKPIEAIKLSRQGEILVKGPNIMKGYYREREKTNKALTHGWLHTGDLGRIDHYGHLYVFERQDDLIVLSTGKNVNPLLIEEKMQEIPAVFKAVVYGYNKPYLVALLFVEKEISGQLEQELRKKLQQINLQLPHYEQIQNIKVLPASEINSPSTLKLSRKKIIGKYSSILESLYEQK